MYNPIMLMAFSSPQLWRPGQGYPFAPLLDPALLVPLSLCGTGVNKSRASTITMSKLLPIFHFLSWYFLWKSNIHSLSSTLALHVQRVFSTQFLFLIFNTSYFGRCFHFRSVCFYSRYVRKLYSVYVWSINGYD